MNAFEVKRRGHYYVIQWQSSSYIDNVIQHSRLFDLIFKNSKALRVGLIVESSMSKKNNENIVWIDFGYYARNAFTDYGNYLLHMYKVCGLILDDESEALTISTELDKNLVWKIIKEG